MNFESLAKLLTEIDHKTLFLRFNPEVLDFTDKESSCELQFFIPDGRIFKIELKDETMPLILSFLGISLFEKDCKILNNRLVVILFRVMKSWGIVASFFTNSKSLLPIRSLSE